MATANTQVGIRKKRWIVCFENSILDMDLSIHEKMVFVVLNSYTDKSGTCFPSIAAIAEKASCSRSKVFEALKSLVEKGLITRKNQFLDGRGQISNVYEINDTKTPDPDDAPGGDSDTTTPSTVAIPPVQSVDTIKYVLEQDHINKDLNPPFTPPGGGAESEPFELESERAEKSGKPDNPESRRFDAICEIYNELLPELPKAEKVTESRKRALRKRIRDDLNRKEFDWWRRYFLRVREYPFLLGDNDKGWFASLDWLIRDESMQKVLEGIYSKKGGSGGRTEAAVTAQEKYTNERGEIDARALLRNSAGAGRAG
jgi:hypothetical protein